MENQYKKTRQRSPQYYTNYNNVITPETSQLKTFVDNRSNTIAQRKIIAQLNEKNQVNTNNNQLSDPIQQQPKENNTGLPDNLKTGIENLSGYSMDDVKVHYNSNKPAQLQAHAYAQGTDIHLASGQERHLPHEAWHVVQQKQGSVKPTIQMKGKVNVNDDAGLEKEADVMGQQALNAGQNLSEPKLVNQPLQTKSVAQLQTGIVVPQYGNEKLKSSRLLSMLKRAFRHDAAEILLQKDEIQKEKQGYLSSIFFSPPKISEHPEILAFEKKVWSVIDALMPKLLGGLPFADAAAAIRFAQNLILERLRADPNMAKQDDLTDILTTFLKESIKSLPVDSEEGDDEEVDNDDEESTKEKFSSKRHNAALGRIGKEDPSTKKYNENLKEASVQAYTARTEHLADELLKVPFASPAVYAKNTVPAKKKEFCKLLDKYSNSNKELTPEEANRANFIVIMTAGLKFDFAAEMLFYLRSAPVDNEATVFRMQHLLRSKFKFPTHPQGQDPNDLAKKFVDFNFITPRRLDIFRKQSGGSGDIPESSKRTEAATAVNRINQTEVEERGEAIKLDKDEEAAALDKNNRAVLVLFDSLKTSYDKLDALAKLVGVNLPKKVEESDWLGKEPSFSKTFQIHLFCTAISKVEKGAPTDEAQEAYEDLLASRRMMPGSANRLKFVTQLKADKLLRGIDPEILVNGAKSMASLIQEAISGGWATKSEIDICSNLLGPRAFIGILGSHISRKKYGPLRSIIEQTMNHREAAGMAPPMTNNSLALDTNMIDILLPAIKDVPKGMRYRRKILDKLIVDRKIKDIRLANMNVAELGDYGRLIGRTIEVEVEKDDNIEKRSLKFLGVPYSKSRSSGTYSGIFKELEAKKVGENKGHADRSMMADLFLAEKEDGHKPTFASADLGVGDEIGTKDGQFDPSPYNLDVQVIETDDPSEKAKSGGTKDGAVGRDGAKKVEEPVKKPNDLSRGNTIFKFIVNGTHTVAEISKLITAETYGHDHKHFQLYIVGGAVRDYIRRSEIHDVDMKTNMPVDTLTELLDKHKLPYHITIKGDLYLVTVSEDPCALDIVCSIKTREEFDKLYGVSDELDLVKDAQERDFTVNALYIDASKNFTPSRKDGIVDPLKAGGVKHAEDGKLRFVADRDTGKDGSEKAWAEVPIEKRAERIVNHLLNHPEELGRTLKFIERGHKEWFGQGQKKKSIRNKKKSQIGSYALDSEVLEILHENAELILEPLITEYKSDVEATKGEDVRKGDSPTARKNYFIHKTGFKTPMDLVRVMQRLQFPPHIIQMVIPDTIAGDFGDGYVAFNRNVSPRNRPTGSPSTWDPKAAPKVKVDITTGELYQQRVYACLPEQLELYRADKTSKELIKILVDVDFTNHAVSGHPSPHHHIFRELHGKWVKKETGFSNTGQPGRADVRLDKGIYVYYGPTPWKWRPERADDESFIKVLKDTCKAANLELEEGSDDMVTIGGQLHVSVNRLEQIDAKDTGYSATNKYRISRLLMLIKTLQQGKVEKDDDSLKYFTQSKRGGERLRFKGQLDKVYEFLKKNCGFEKGGEKMPKLTHDDRLRIYDLISAGYGELESRPAAKYAMSQLDSSFSAAKFVEYFEFYIASVANKTSGDDVALLNKRMMNHSKSLIWRDSVQSLNVPKDASDDDMTKAINKYKLDLRFNSGTAAAYHLIKHSEVTKSEPESYATNKGIKEAAHKYIAEIQKAISEKPEKVVHESQNIKVFFFKLGDVTVIIEAELKGKDWEARILSCYGKDGEKDVVVDAPVYEGYLPTSYGSETESSPTKLDHVYKTSFGVLKKEATLNNGNCFFDAVRQSGNLAQNVTTLRRLAADTINPDKRADQEWLEPFLTSRGSAREKLNRLKTQIGQDCFWAGNSGDFVPYMMARALNRSIYILSGLTGGVITVAGHGRNPIYVFYNGSNHYEASSRVVQ